MLWIDNMAIPKGVAHPLDAHLLMNYCTTSRAPRP